MNKEQGHLESIRFGTVPFEYPRDEPAPVENAIDIARSVRLAEWLVKLIYSGRTDRVRHMYASVGLALLKNQLCIREIAVHYNVTTERVAQVVKKVRSFEISERP